MRIENGYLQQSMLCSKNNRNAVGNFSDTMNKAQECISNKISTRDSYVNSTDYSNFLIYTLNSIFFVFDLGLAIFSPLIFNMHFY